MSDADTHSTLELESDVASSRARVEETVDEIQRRLTPGQLIDEVMSLSRSSARVAQHGRTFGAKLIEQIVENPLPVALIGIGLVWLALGSSRSPKPDTPPSQDQEPTRSEP